MVDRPRLSFGITAGIPDLPGKSHAEHYRDTITMVKTAEDLGFDHVWFTEHHFSKHGLDSAVLTMMAALARETSRIRLGTSVCVLPFWNVVRLAEEVAVVDIVSDGRFEFGVGSGYRLHEFTGLGVDPAERIPRYLESLEIVEKVFTGEPFTHDGEFYHIDSRGLRPLPVQKPHPPLWATAMNEPGLRWIGGRGGGWMFGPNPGQPLEALHPLRDIYYDAIRLTGAEPRIYLQVGANIANRPTAEVRTEAEPWVRWWFEAVGRGDTIWGKAQENATVEQKAINDFYEMGFHGDPDEALRKIDEYARFGVTDFGFQITFGPPIERLIETMETFAKHVLPVARQWGDLREGWAGAGQAVRPAPDQAVPVGPDQALSA